MIFHKNHRAYCLRSLLFILWYTLLGSFYGCGEDDSKGNDSMIQLTGTFLTQADLAPPNASELLAFNESSDLVEAFADNRDMFQNEKPEEKEEEEEEDSSDVGDQLEACTKQLENAALTADSQGNFSFGWEFDLAKCFAQAASNTNPLGSDSETESASIQLNFTKAKFKVFIRGQCPGTDLSSLNGKPIISITELGQSEVCSTANEPQSLMTNIETHVGFKVTGEFFGQAIIRESESITREYTGNPTFDGPCTGTQTSPEVQTQTAGCTKIKIVDNIKSTNNDAPDEADGKKSYFSAVFSELTGPKDSEWYTSGTAEVTAGAWKGQVTYTDATTPPTYEMTKDGQSKTGSLTSSAAALNSFAFKFLRNSKTLPPGPFASIAL